MQPREGRSLWVWHLVDIQDIIKKAHAMNADTLIIKAHNGSDYWSQFNAVDVRTLQRAGFHVGAWGYCYPEASNTPQMSCVSKSFDNCAEFYVCDAEIEFEQPGLTVSKQFMYGVRKIANGKPVGFTSFAFPSYHPNFPWQEFAKYSDFTMPQIYWGDFKRDVYSAFVQSVAEYQKLGKPVVPIGQLYGGVSNSEINMFLQLSGQNSSWWDYAHLTPNQYSVFTRGGSAMQLNSNGPDVVTLQKDLALVLKQPIKDDGFFGPVTETAVKSFQQLYGVRPVDGIVGPVTTAVLKHEVALHTPKPVPVTVQPKVEPKPEPEPPKPTDLQVASTIVNTLQSTSNVKQAMELLSQALKLLEGVE